MGAGRLIVGDREEPHLRIFDLQGNLTAAVAREGEDPGEMSYPLAVASVEDGIAAVDMRWSRVIRIDAEGNDRGTVRLPSFPLAAGFEPGSEYLDVALAD